MEGRAIARPNRPWRAECARRVSCFNGGPGNCPAELRLRSSLVRRSIAASMEGRAIARPNAGGAAGSAGPADRLQWRAGQLPGRTRSPPGGGRCCSCFNGGPGNCPAELLLMRRCRWLRWSFNGGPGNCPAERPGVRCRHGTHRRASMEGRAIARPNSRISPHNDATIASMEGRAIARPNEAEHRQAQQEDLVLQWRAGQLPGRTSALFVNQNPIKDASMEGRAIARPNGSQNDRPAHSMRQLQWRAGQLPGRTCASSASVSCSIQALQWRAGQLPGRTVIIAYLSFGCNLLQWRAGQLPGRTWTSFTPAV